MRRVCNAIERCCRLGSRTTTTSSMQTVSPGLRFSLNKKRGSGASGAPTSFFANAGRAEVDDEDDENNMDVDLGGMADEQDEYGEHGEHGERTARVHAHAHIRSEEEGLRQGRRLGVRTRRARPRLSRRAAGGTGACAHARTNGGPSS